MDAIRWGILGTGKIARLFAADLALLPEAELAAVGSRAQATADAFGDDFGVPRRHASYEALVADEGVDVVYVATPHPFHAENAIRALEAGKAVLCEKPLAMSVAEAEAVVAAARSADAFLMEALWTRFLPLMADVRRALDAGAVGEPQLLLADIGAHVPFDPDHRMYDPALGGGALLDLGVYPIQLAHWLFGPPEVVTSTATMGASGVDEQSSYLFRYADGQQAVLAASARTDAQRTATIAGPEGRLVIHRPWWKGTRCTLTTADGEETVFARPYEGSGYQFEAAHVGRCLREGRTESAVMPLSVTLAVLRTMDGLRADWGLRYPGEE